MSLVDMYAPSADVDDDVAGLIASRRAVWRHYRGAFIFLDDERPRTKVLGQCVAREDWRIVLAMVRTEIDRAAAFRLTACLGVHAGTDALRRDRACDA